MYKTINGLGSYRKRHLWHGVPLALYLCFAAMVSLDPADYQSHCFGQRLLGIPCPFCGTTRAIGHLYRGEMQEAWSLNPMALPFFVAALLLLSYRAVCIIKPRQVRLPLQFELRLYQGVAGLFGGVWLIRLLLNIYA